MPKKLTAPILELPHPATSYPLPQLRMAMAIAAHLFEVDDRTRFFLAEPPNDA